MSSSSTLSWELEVYSIFFLVILPCGFYQRLWVEFNRWFLLFLSSRRGNWLNICLSSICPVFLFLFIWVYNCIVCGKVFLEHISLIAPNLSLLHVKKGALLVKFNWNISWCLLGCTFIFFTVAIFKNVWYELAMN